MDKYLFLTLKVLSGLNTSDIRNVPRRHGSAFLIDLREPVVEA